MKNLVVLRCVAAVLVLVGAWPAPAWGWGKEGHQIVGFIAEKHLTDDARAAIAELLGDGNRISDEDVSNWADTVRNVVRSTGPWHYVDIPIDSGEYDARRDCRYGDCVVARIEKFRQVLADKNARRTDRVEALKFLVHFVGDLHQPLHCAERKDSSGTPDRGGNLCKVRFLDETSETNLHRVWDTSILVHSLGETSLADYADRLSAEISAEEQAAWRSGRARQWAVESNKAAVQHVYAGVPADGPATHLAKPYVTASQKVVDDQLSKAGIRLAEILNQALKP